MFISKYYNLNYFCLRKYYGIENSNFFSNQNKNFPFELKLKPMFSSKYFKYSVDEYSKLEKWVLLLNNLHRKLVKERRKEKKKKNSLWVEFNQLFRSSQVYRWESTTKKYLFIFVCNITFRILWLISYDVFFVCNITFRILRLISYNIFFTVSSENAKVYSYNLFLNYILSNNVRKTSISN